MTIASQPANSPDAIVKASGSGSPVAAHGRRLHGDGQVGWKEREVREAGQEFVHEVELLTRGGLPSVLVTIPYERLPPFQQRVGDFVDAHDLRTGAEARLLDLLAELGELAKEALKTTGYGRRPFVPDERWDDELGDVFFSLVCLANSTAVDLDQALDRALAKYRQRLGERGDAGSGR